MSDLQIVIPTKGRMPRQATLGYLPPEWCQRTTLVVNEADASLRRLYDLRGASVLVHPPEVDTIAKKRQWIIENPVFNKIVMLDDDLRFAHRTPGEGTKLHQATHEEIDAALRWIEDTLRSGVIHCGWSARQGNNNVEESVLKTARMMFVLGYDCMNIRHLIANGHVTLGRVRTREDMELTIQLLKCGYWNEVNFNIAADQVSGFGAKGGCFDERTIESTSADAEAFAALHPGLVKVVEKSYKGSPNRKEVIVQWKKALGAGVQ